MRRVKEGDIDKQLFQMRRELQSTEEKESIMHQQELIEFRWRGFSVGLPMGFREAEKDEKALLFINKNRPDIVFIHSQEAAGFTFRVTAQAESYQSEDLDVIMNQMRETLLAADRNLVFYEDGQLGGNIPVVWFNYKSFAVDERIYNIIFLFRNCNDLVIGTFYCQLKDYERWKQKVLWILTTIKIGEELHERV